MQRESIERQSSEENIGTRLPEYVRPSIRVMSENELLTAMQINAAGTSWWVM